METKLSLAGRHDSVVRRSTAMTTPQSHDREQRMHDLREVRGYLLLPRVSRVVKAISELLAGDIFHDDPLDAGGIVGIAAEKMHFRNRY